MLFWWAQRDIIHRMWHEDKVECLVLNVCFVYSKYSLQLIGERLS